MANSYTNYTGNGIKDTYVIPFGFLAKTHIQATINTVETGDFQVIGSTIVFDTPPVADAAIKVFRVTPRRPLVEYFDGGSPRASQQNTAALQALYIAQEIEDGTLTGEAVIPNNSLTVTKLERVDSGTILGRKTSGTGNVEKLTTAEVKTALGLAAVATSGAYTDLSEKPTLATVAITGAYDDLTGKPTVASANEFFAYRTSSASSGVDIVFDTEDFDVGSLYDTTSGRFVAPSSGRYVFVAGISWSGSTGQQLDIKIFKNGVLFDAFGDTTGDGGNFSRRGTWIMNLSTSDYVTIRSSYAPAYTASWPRAIFFGGYKIS